MVAHIRSIATAVPHAVLLQDHARDIFAAQPELTRLGKRLVATAFDNAAVSTRHTVVDELVSNSHDDAAVFFDSSTGVILSPETGTRNAVYSARAPELFTTAAKRALATSGGLGPSDVTHVITVSCTGFVAPGPDLWVVTQLGLSPATQRFHLGFMGCYGAFPALRAADAFCMANPNAVVLIVCAELCSLHLHSSNVPDTIVSSSVFADGAAACIVTARTETKVTQPILQITGLSTVVTATGADDMAWSIGNNGFDMVLSNYVPHIIEENIAQAIRPLFADQPTNRVGYRSVAEWAIHPGGRGILDRVQQALALSDDQLAPSRAVLRNYGNMSSATVLFILKDLLAGDEASGAGTAGSDDRVCAMAFGPGLTVESGLFRREILHEGRSRP